MTIQFILKVLFPCLLGLGVMLWGAITLGFASESRDFKWGQSLWSASQRQAPTWWRKFSVWFLGLYALLGIVWLLLMKFITDEP